MSYANGTTHYNLPQTVGTDKRDWFDSNAAFAAVDAALYAVVTGQASDAEAITALQQTVAGQATDIAALQTASSSHAASISALQTAVNGQATQIADVRQDAEDMITANNEGAAATSTRAYAVGDYFIYNDVLYKATDAIAIGDTIVPNTNCEATNVDTELTKLKSKLKDATVLLTLPNSTTWADACVAIQAAVRNSDIDFSKLRLRFYSANEDNYALLEPVQQVFASTGAISFLGFVYTGGNLGVRMIRTHATVVSESDGLTQWTSVNWTGNHTAVTDGIGGKIELIVV